MKFCLGIFMGLVFLNFLAKRPMEVSELFVRQHWTWQLGCLDIYYIYLELASTGLQGDGLPTSSDVKIPVVEFIKSSAMTTSYNYVNRRATYQNFPNTCVLQSRSYNCFDREAFHRLATESKDFNPSEIFAVAIHLKLKLTPALQTNCAYESMGELVGIPAKPGGSQLSDYFLQVESNELGVKTKIGSQSTSIMIENFSPVSIVIGVRC